MLLLQEIAGSVSDILAETLHTRAVHRFPASLDRTDFYVAVAQNVGQLLCRPYGGLVSKRWVVIGADLYTERA